MSTLIKASKTLKNDTFINPIWQIIYKPFQKYLHATIDHPEFATDFATTLYVRERVSPLGVSEDDVEEHIDNDTPNVLLILASAGLGKTTFLHHATRIAAATEGIALIWVNLLSLASEPRDADLLYQKTLARINHRLEAVVTRNKTDWLPYWEFVLQHWSDPNNVATVLLGRMRRGEPIDGDFETKMMSILERMGFEDKCRLRFAYMRERFQRKPVLVVDNSDMLPVDFQRRLVRLAFTLARGTGLEESSGNTGAGYPWKDHCPTLLAVRPETLYAAQADPGKSSPAVAVALIRRGDLHAPVLRKVFEKRLEHFLEEFEGRIARGIHFSTARHRIDFKALMPDTPPADYDRRLREIVRHLASQLLDDALLNLLQPLLNYNTRLSLLAAVNYVASGHHAWADLLSHSAQTHSFKGTPRATHILFVGPNTIYTSETCWVRNLFDTVDSSRQGVLLKPRILSYAIRSELELPTRDTLAADVGQALDLAATYVSDAIDLLIGWGLMKHRSASVVEASEAGKVYMHNLVRDFEYLQDVIVDSPVSHEYLVECRERDEPTSLRCSRVLRYAAWLRELEAHDVARAIEGGRLDLYLKVVGEEPMAFVVASACQKALPRITRLVLESSQRSGSRAESRSPSSLESTFRDLESNASELATRSRLRQLIDDATESHS